MDSNGPHQPCVAAPVCRLSAALLLLIATACGPTNPQPDGGPPGPDAASADGAIEDAGELMVSSAELTEITASEPDDSFDAVEAPIYTAVAVADSTDSDETLVLLDTDPPPLPHSDCRTRTPTVNPVGFEVDYSGCTSQGSAGLVQVERLGGGSWLFRFNDAFTYRGVDIDGFAVLARQQPGRYGLSSADGTGAQLAAADLVVTRQGPQREVVRKIRFDGRLDVVDQPLSAFDFGADGSIRRSDDSGVMDLGIGGPRGGTKDSPLRVHRPNLTRCPDRGAIHLGGRFSLLLRLVFKVTIDDEIHQFDVDLGRRDFDGAFRIDFDRNASHGILDLDLRPLTPLRADKDRLRDGLDRSGLGDRVKRAIHRHIDNNDAPVLPDQVFSDGAREVLRTLFADGDLCGGA